MHTSACLCRCQRRVHSYPGTSKNTMSNYIPRLPGISGLIFRLNVTFWGVLETNSGRCPEVVLGRMSQHEMRQSRYKKLLETSATLLGTSATLVVTGALLVVTRSYWICPDPVSLRPLRIGPPTSRDVAARRPGGTGSEPNSQGSDFIQNLSTTFFHPSKDGSMGIYGPSALSSLPGAASPAFAAVPPLEPS